MESLSGLRNWFETATLLDLLGVTGVLIYVGAYLCLQLGLLKGDGFAYPALNLTASLSVLASLTANFNPYSVAIETSWSLISIVGLTRLYFVHHHIRLTPDEAVVANRLLPGVKKDRARQLIRLGRFVDALPGEVVATEGHPVRDLAFVLAGACGVDRGGVPVARLGPGALVGEMTFATGAPATANVIVAEPSRLYLVDRGALSAHLARNPDLAATIEQSIASDLRVKLAETTARLSRAIAEGRS
ncbi:cyclic nucleotide-binding domain-containing protein [Tabrizicola sp. J26]|uniref:Crp/Fnr family transcriptional regulator n=1 Tax=Alitabrizicola rongguiensis TaxID=2909234 RepID=UPI001F315ABF|nr:cyclic nucleotide-binding domain-containing protein [Tabrizicola rongguiensis]MCF1708341.1 cyclic nucleotide-binding domain-containing protein [Tabrizicola rongguiensis]